MSLNLGHIRIAFPPLLAGAVGARLTRVRRGVRADSYRLTFERNGERRDLLVKHFKVASEFVHREMASGRLFADLNVHVVPPLIALHEQRLLLVTRYLSETRDFMSVLATGGDIELAMRQLGRVMAGSIAATCIDYALPSERDDTALRCDEADALERRLDGIVTWAGQLGVGDGPALHDALGRLVLRYRDPLRVSWTQGDPAPSNVLFTPNRAWLVDFEYGGWRHALHDLAQWAVRVPLPNPWHATLAETVRESLLRGGIYADDAAFGMDLAVMQAYAAVYMLGWLPVAEVVAADRPWVDGWTVRDALICATGRGASAARDVPGLEPVAHWLATLHVAARSRWPERGTGEPDWHAIASAGAGRWRGSDSLRHA
jgi:hypothetical protein